MNIAIILSGGVGSRISSDVPKQYIEIGGLMIITRCIKAVLQCGEIDALVVVAGTEWRDVIRKEAEDCAGASFTGRFKGFCDPGENRQLSIYNGLKYLEAFGEASDSDIVIVHDAARPLVSAELLSGCISACAEHDGAMPVLPMKDTVYFSENGKKVASLLDRGKIFAGQAPEAFLFGKYLKANEALLPEDILAINGASEPAVMAGMDIAMIKGDEDNFKITTDNDLDKYRSIIETLNTEEGPV